MNKQKFIEYIQSPHLLDSTSISSLDEVLKNFPYCQTAQLLYIKTLYKENNINYNSQLKVAAAYIADRKKLYLLINLPVKPEPELKAEDAAVTNTDTAVSVAPPEVIAPAPPPATTIIAEEISLPETKTAQPKDRQQELREIIQQRLSEIGGKQPDIQETAMQSEPVKQEQPEIQEPVMQNEPVQPEQEKRPEETVEKPVLKTENAEESAKKRKIQEDIINNFIGKQPAIAKPSKEFFNPVNMALKSTIDNEDFVTETLAKIYYRQGNISKAIKTYEKLSLLFPEKSSYFASLIEKIKKETTN